MKNILKRIFLVVLVGVLLFGVLMYNISYWVQERNFQKYTDDFNLKRNAIRLRTIPKNWKLEKLTWNNWDKLNFFDNELEKYAKIFSLKDINTTMSYKNDSLGSLSNYQRKIIWFNSNILFWKNEIRAEMDFYERKIDSNTIEYLTIKYHFKDENGKKNYFETNYSMNKLDEFTCGSAIIMEKERHRMLGKPYFGNISKEQADSILIQWEEKN